MDDSVLQGEILARETIKRYTMISSRSSMDEEYYTKFLKPLMQRVRGYWYLRRSRNRE